MLLFCHCCNINPLFYLFFFYENKQEKLPQINRNIKLLAVLSVLRTYALIPVTWLVVLRGGTTKAFHQPPLCIIGFGASLYREEGR